MQPRVTWNAIGLVLSLLVVSCAPARPAPIGRVVPTAAGTTEEVVSWTALSGTNADGRSVLWSSATALLFSKGENPPVPLRPGDSLPLRIEIAPWHGRLDGRVVSLRLADAQALRWLALATPSELAGLRYVIVPDSVTPAMRIALERLARANPQVTLELNDSASTAAVLPLFRPRALVVSGDDAALAVSLPEQSQLQELWLTEDEVAPPVYAAILALPDLRRLMITGRVEPLPRFPAGIEELAVRNDRELDARLLSGLSRLRVLQLGGTTWTNGSDLAASKELRWLALPQNVSQAEFEAIVRAHPDLEALEMQKADSVVDLSPLRGLQHLKALAIDGTPAQLAVARDLRSLEYLAVAEAADEALIGDIVAVRTALPNATLVEWRPMCLGSGWILLLVPLVALFAYAWPRRRAA